MTQPTAELVEARCDKCPQTALVREGFTDQGEFFREQAFCPRGIHHSRQRKMKPLGVMPGTVQVKVARRLRNTD